MKMLGVLEEVNKFLRKTEEKTNKKLEEINKSLKESQEKSRTGEGNSSRLKNCNIGNKENIN